MKKFGKKALSMLLVALMVVSIVPVTKIEAEAASSYMWPVLGGSYTSSKYSKGYHNGMDIASTDGGKNKIISTASGKVIEVSNGCDCTGKTVYYRYRTNPDKYTYVTCSDHKATYGNYVKIQNDDGTYAVYGHIKHNSIVVKVGDRVSQGQHIATIGDSGVSTGIHLHFEIRTNKSSQSSCINLNNISYLSAKESGGTGGGEITGGGLGTGQVYTNVSKTVGTYKANESVRLRSYYGTNGSTQLLLIPKGSQVNITETKYNWGKCTYNGKTGWTCLDYYTQVSVPDATTPKITSITANDMAQGKNCVITWGGSSNAVRYEVSVNNGPVINCGTNTSYQQTLTEAKTYSFKVRAVNSVGKETSWSTSISCVSHAPCAVTVKDYNGKEIEKKYVDYGGDISIQAPSREGYTFQGWDGSTHGITKDITLTPIYKINTYNVKFWGNNDQQLGETQKVNYGEDATPPADTGAPENYEFVNWSSEDYKNVYTDASDKTINVYAIYKWANEDIPITCEITEAYRDKEGYHVMYNLKNNISSTRNGRAIITLKTAEGKLVYTTESKAFSMPGNSEKNNIDEFFECDETASVIEIIIVNSYTSGIPVSKSVTKKVTDGLGWSNWQDGTAPAGVEAEERTVYRYRDKQTTTANTKTLSGWTWDGTRSESTTIGGWQDNTVSTYENESTRLYLYDQQTVQKYRQQRMYCYYHFYKSGGGNHTWCSLSTHANGTWHTTHVANPAKEMTYTGQSDCNSSKARYSGPACSKCGKATIWFESVNDADDYIDYNYPDGTKQQYRYATTKYTYNFWRWMDWSDWLTTTVAETASRDVETKTQYRTYNGVEDTSGTSLTKKYYAGTDFAGKQATLFVYKFDAASDYTDEFVGQAVVGNDGYCTFNIKLREQPSIKTGDFTVALGIEGTTNTFVVDTFEAPKPTYTVNFYDWDGTIIETQTVTEGESATLPSYIPEKEGYDFIGWSDTLTNVREDRDIFADMEKREYQVIFVDWENQLIEVKTFQHGDVLVTPDFTQVEGYTFAGWDAINEGKVLVTGNMVVTAQYKANVYTVKFCDYDGNVIDVQEVEYGKTALPPEDVESADDKQFAGWYDPEKYEYVEHDISVFPAYYYEETANIPTANYESGEFNQSLKLTLTTDDENEVIFYYLNGDETTEQIYTGPIDITKTTSVTYYASCINKNDSEAVTQYYCINTSNTFSGWMPYNSLPEDVRVNTKDYNLENADGYRYKNTVKTSSVADAADYVADGWEYLSEEYSAYSAWQDAEIKVDNTRIGFEVETREAEDTTKQRYKLTRYKYTDANGSVAYSNTEVEGYTCTLEETFIELNDPAANPAGFFEGNTSIFYWEIDGEMWFNRKTVSGVKTQYRSRYKVNSYYKWSEWGVTGPTPLETREYETNTVYRYSNRNYSIVRIHDFDQTMVFMVEHGDTIDESHLPTTVGYDFGGVYYDELFEQTFNMDTPITESMDLYIRFEPKEFTVIFQTDGGFELDVQKVKYMEAATEPSVFNMTGYVFSKWDKDFSCITEDTVVTGRYYKESDYARISLDRTVLDMFQGTEVQLNYTITPENLASEAVEWSSSDPNIATVDDKGVVTALVPGEVTITAMVTKTRETATCRVIVNEDCGNYIVLTANSTLNNDSLGYLRRIGFNTTVNSAMVNFRNDNLEFYNIDGNKLTGTSVVGTGTTIVLKNGENVLDKETIVITGDMTGDGLLNNRDVAMVNRYLVNKVTPQECQVVALDLNGDGYINNKDAAMAARYLVGKDAII